MHKDLIRGNAWENTGRSRRRLGEPLDCDACLTLREGEREGRLNGSISNFPVVYIGLGKAVREPQLAISGVPWLPEQAALVSLSHSVTGQEQPMRIWEAWSRCKCDDGSHSTALTHFHWRSVKCTPLA